jgi:predicted DCC family thiol-disulfide oxidoreductase YuxK
MKTAAMLDIIYDGNCGFCIRSLQILNLFAVGAALRFHDFHQTTIFEKFPNLRNADLQDAMYVLAWNERPHRGFYAFRRILWESPLLWPLRPLFYFPGIGLIGTRVYAWIARNRRQIGCESDVCALGDNQLSIHGQDKE